MDETGATFKRPRHLQTLKILTMKNKKLRTQFLNDNWKLETLNFTWTKAGVCHLTNKRDEKIASAGGYGYDKKGTCFGQFLNIYFGEELKKLTANSGSGDTPTGFYGLTHYNPTAKSHKRRYLKRAPKDTKTYVDGACGFSSMQRILNKIGFKLNFIFENKNQIVYQLEVK